MLGKAEEYLKKPLRIKQLLNDAYKKASERKDVGTIAHEVWESLQILSRMIKAAVTGEYTGIPTRTLVGGVAVLMYFLSPIDFVPDFIPIIGLLDDAALLAWFMTSIKGEMDKFEHWEKNNQARAMETAMMSSNQPVDTAANTPKYRPDDSYQSPTYPTAGSSQVANKENNPSGQQRNEDGTLKNDQSKLQVKDFTPHDLNTESNTPDDSAIRVTTSGAGDPNVRAITTDSTRIPNSNDNDRVAGGNVR
jgi:uncharacterized membrane protein YkvA (DUF1232 family)